MIRMLFWISQSHIEQNTEMLLEKGAALLPFTYFTFTMPICDLQMQHKNSFELIHVVKGEGISQDYIQRITTNQENIQKPLNTRCIHLWLQWITSDKLDSAVNSKL